MLVLDPRVPTEARGGDTFDGGNGRWRGTAVDIAKQAARWPGEETDGGGGGWAGEEGSKRYGDGDVLVLDPDQGAVRRKVPGAPAFEKQVGWRERQAAEALESDERSRERRGAWGWAEAGGGDGADDDRGTR